MFVFTQPLRHEQDVTQGQFELSSADLNSHFFSSKTTRCTKPSLSYSQGRINGFMPQTSFEFDPRWLPDSDMK